MGLLDGVRLGPHAAPREVAQAAEALVLRQLFTEVHLGGCGAGPGAALHADLFAETLAEAVANAGGLGLAEALQAHNALGTGANPDSAPALKTAPGRAEGEAERSLPGTRP